MNCRKNLSCSLARFVRAQLSNRANHDPAFGNTPTTGAGPILNAPSFFAARENLEAEAFELSVVINLAPLSWRDAVNLALRKPVYLHVPFSGRHRVATGTERCGKLGRLIAHINAEKYGLYASWGRLRKP